MAEETNNPFAIEFDAQENKNVETRLLEALDRDAEVAQLAALLQSEHMRDFLWRVLSKCHMYHSIFNRNYGDMSMAEGMRNVGLWLLSEIAEADPEAEILMKQKANRIAAQGKAQERRRRRRSAATP